MPTGHFGLQRALVASVVFLGAGALAWQRGAQRVMALVCGQYHAQRRQFRDDGLEALRAGRGAMRGRLGA